MERLGFGYGTNKHTAQSGVLRRNADAGRARGAARAAGRTAASLVPKSAAVPEERRDWAFLGLMVFTAVLFFRPQDLVTPLRVLPLAEIAALFALGSLIGSR